MACLSQALRRQQHLRVRPPLMFAVNATPSSPESRPGREPCTPASRRSRCRCRVRVWTARSSLWTEECPRRWAVPDVRQRKQNIKQCSGVPVFSPVVELSKLCFYFIFSPLRSDGVPRGELSSGAGGWGAVVSPPAPHPLLHPHTAHIQRQRPNSRQPGTTRKMRYSKPGFCLLIQI